MLRNDLIESSDKGTCIRSSFFQGQVELNLVQIIEIALGIPRIKIMPSKYVDFIFVKADRRREPGLDKVLGKIVTLEPVFSFNLVKVDVAKQFVCFMIGASVKHKVIFVVLCVK
jgi:hypothetical protein